MEKLIPNPVHTVALMVWFVVMYFILKNILFVPYLEALSQRHADTDGAADEFDDLHQQIEHANEAYKEALDKARHDAHGQRDEIIQNANKETQTILDAGQKAVAEKLTAARSEIDAERKTALGELQQSVPPLADQAVNKLLGDAA